MCDSGAVKRDRRQVLIRVNTKGAAASATQKVNTTQFNNVVIRDFEISINHVSGLVNVQGAVEGVLNNCGLKRLEGNAPLNPHCCSARHLQITIVGKKQLLGPIASWCH